MTSIYLSLRTHKVLSTEPLQEQSPAPTSCLVGGAWAAWALLWDEDHTHEGKSRVPGPGVRAPEDLQPSPSLGHHTLLPADLGLFLMQDSPGAPPTPGQVLRGGWVTWRLPTHPSPQEDFFSALCWPGTLGLTYSPAWGRALEEGCSSLGKLKSTHLEPRAEAAEVTLHKWDDGAGD